MEMDRLIPFREAGSILGGRSEKTVRRMIASGDLPKPVYIGRTPMLCLSDIVGLIEKLKQKRKEHGEI
jgi:predicted DNA-binding transcriptional regulator AlpA